MESTLGAIYQFLEPLWVEACFAVFFPLGWILVHKLFWRSDLQAPGKTQKAPQISQGRNLRSIVAASDKLHQDVEAAVVAGNMEEAVTAWRAVNQKVPPSPDTIRLVSKALLTANPSNFVQEMLEHLDTHRASIHDTRVPVAVLEVLSHSPNIMEEMHKVFREKLNVRPTSQVFEALLGGYSAHGFEDKVTKLLAEMKTLDIRLSPRGHALIIKGLLLCGRLDSALVQVDAMRKQGFYVPPFALTMLLKVAKDTNRKAEVFENVKDEVAASPEALVCLFEDCAKSGDVKLAEQMEGIARNIHGGQLPALAYGPLLRTHVNVASVYALKLLDEMHKLQMRGNDGFYVSIMARCAETKFLRFAEELARVLRDTGGMSISMYSALMKVYAYCGLYGRACDLYPEIIERGLTPDGVMYGCLMKFAVEAGRTDLLQQLFDSSPQPGIQSYMSLIRSAGRDKDVNKAFAVLKQLSESGLRVDRGAYNCVLDACVCAGDLTRARSFLAELRSQGLCDIVSYNTILKGYCIVGDMRGSQELFLEMEADNLKPDEITFNCMINAAVTAGDLRKAWDMVAVMEKSGSKIDKFTVSIMLKALKSHASSRDLQRALALLDRVGLDLCSDGALMNIAIETCIRHREMGRLQELIESWERSSLQPGVHTYASLIKACGVLRNIDRCRTLWKQMVEERGTDPNDVVLGCMLDALVCNGQVDDAVALFNQWKDTVGANMILYSTLVKGFAAEGRADEAMTLWKQIRSGAAQMNTVVYNSLIDVQARVGNMERAHTLFAGMEEDGVKPDSITYSTMVKGYCMSGNLDSGFEVFRNTQRAGMAPDCIVYNTILDGCTRHNRMDLADLVLQDMENNKIPPSIFTLGILVKMYGRRRKLDKAFEVLETLPRKYGLVPNVQVKTCLISACVCNGALDRGLEVFEEMKNHGEGFVDSKAYGVMISGFLRIGRADKAAALVEEAYGLNGGKRMLPPRQQISPENLEHLMKSLTANGKHQQIGVPLLEKLRDHKIPLNGRLLSFAFDADAKTLDYGKGDGKGDGKGRPRWGGGRY